ncbi:MAG: guanylate kinase [Acidobacteria bacterium]|nr:guanylate kinase [Acidobacteriota bacterium]
MKPTGNLIVISAPSGAGKTSIVRRVLAEIPDLRFSVSYTTRPPRQGEVHGKDYFFVDAETFRKMQSGNEFYEWAEVYGQLKGTSRRFVEKHLTAGTDVLLDIDVQGAKIVKKIKNNAILIFITPPSYPELARRLRGRGLDDEEQIHRRLRTAYQEMGDIEMYDYFVVNEDLASSCRQVESIILANRCRRENNRQIMENILATFGDNADVEATQ